MVPYAKENAEILPADFEENLEKLFQDLFMDSAKTIQTLEKMITALKNVLHCSGLDFLSALSESV